MPAKTNSLFQLAVIVSALGFFVDTYDLLLFTIVRVPSLTALGLPPGKVFTTGQMLLNVQMAGMLIGGIIFGVLGDKRGRVKVLYGSILLYSVANILNGAVHEIWQYTLLRFLAGVGLAGELGAGVTLASETLPKEKRSTAAGIIAGCGLFGAVAAFFLNHALDNWRYCYYIGGGLGFVLLALRVKLNESGLFNNIKQSGVARGNFMVFFTRRSLFSRYIKCILIGIPAWYIIGVLVAFSDQFGKAMGINGIDPGRAIMILYLAIAIGDFSVGWLCEKLKSRKKTLFIFYGITILFVALYFLQGSGSAATFYIICAGIGYGTGFNVVYITMGAEQFGTNLRATAAISIPNMVRGALLLITLLFKVITNATGSITTGGWVTGVILFVMAITAGIFIPETYGRELTFIEE
ncbi:MAG TPA: MFS transporter [Chitinophagaceae bacterium]|nr:MFS transporter [Chitinophagaceae bacterium]